MMPGMSLFVAAAWKVDAGVPSVVVDTMENNFADLLGAWPLRFFVLGGDSGGERASQ